MTGSQGAGDQFHRAEYRQVEYEERRAEKESENQRRERGLLGAAPPEHSEQKHGSDGGARSEAMALMASKILE